MRIYSVEIKNNPILGDIKLDFTDLNGNIADTVIFAGENGCGKSTLLDCLTELNSIDNFAENESRHFLLEIDEKLSSLLLEHKQNKPNKPIVRADYYIEKRNNTMKFNISYFTDRDMTEKFQFTQFINNKCIYLTPEITFTPEVINQITAKNVDIPLYGLRKSDNKIATEITQLIIDISTQDKFDFNELYENSPRSDYSEMQRSPRISRFNKAFSKIIPNFYIKKVDNINEHKVVTFYNNGKVVPISKLSSGEKQIVFRGGYLLKDKNTLQGSLVLIDEPELSLHPDWQKKILDYYKTIFTDENGKQTSQIFIATHSPYIIHNENRKNDKVLVLKKDNTGKVTIMDEPVYYSCGDLKVVADAFNEKLFPISTKTTVYLEGRTDEKYFNKALEVFNISPSWQFKWVGYLDDNEQERNTGKDSLNKAKEFMISSNMSIKNICLYDSDSNKKFEEYKNVISYAIPEFQSVANIKKGIENALVLDDINLKQYYSNITKIDDYGAVSIISNLDKMKLCDSICDMPIEKLEKILANLKIEIDKINKILKK